MLRRGRTPAAVAAIGCLVFASAALAVDYVAYSVSEDGRVALPDRLDDIPGESLVNVEWGDYSGPRKRVAVLEVENKSDQRVVTVDYGDGSTKAEVATRGVPVNGIEAMLTDSLFRSGRFRMMERQKIKKALEEQDFGASGRVTAESAAEIGKVIGAETLVQAVVTHYAPDFKGKSGGLGGLTDGLLGGLKFGKKSSLVGMNFRMLNANTGEVLFTRQVKAVISDTNFGIGALGFGDGGAAGGAFSSFSKTPIGQAVIACVNKGTYELVKQIGAQPASGKVVKMSGNKVYINIGSNAVNPGDRLTVKAVGEELVDPDTGISLGSEETEVAQLLVSQAKQKFSIATIQSKSGRFDRGDKVVANERPQPLRFAESWEGKKAGDNDSSAGSSPNASSGRP